MNKFSIAHYGDVLHYQMFTQTRAYNIYQYRSGEIRAHILDLLYPYNDVYREFDNLFDAFAWFTGGRL